MKSLGFGLIVKILGTKKKGSGARPHKVSQFPMQATDFDITGSVSGRRHPFD